MRTQLADYFDYVSTQQGTVDVVDIVDPVTPVPAPVPVRGAGRGWWVAAAAAVVALVVLGLMSALLSREPTAPPASEPATTTTTSEGTVPGDDTDTAPTTTVAVTDETISPPVIPSDALSSAGPIGFTKTEGLGRPIWEARLVQRSPLRATVDDGTVLSTADGFEWRVEPVPTTGTNDRQQTITTDGSRLAIAAGPDTVVVGSESCSMPGDITVHALDIEGVWTTSEIALPYETEPSGTGCFRIWSLEVNLREGETMVSMSLSATLPMEAIIEDALGSEVVENLSMVAEVPEGLLVSWNDDENEALIDFDELGIREDIDAFSSVANEVIGSDEASMTWFGERPRVWWSADGETWEPLDLVGPAAAAHQVQVFPTDAGFILTPDEGTPSLVRLGEVIDTAPDYEGNVRRWRGELVLLNGDGITSIDTGELLVPRGSTRVCRCSRARRFCSPSPGTLRSGISIPLRKWRCRPMGRSSSGGCPKTSRLIPSGFK